MVHHTPNTWAHSIGGDPSWGWRAGLSHWVIQPIDATERGRESDTWSARMLEKSWLFSLLGSRFPFLLHSYLSSETQCKSGIRGTKPPCQCWYTGNALFPLLPTLSTMKIVLNNLFLWILSLQNELAIFSILRDAKISCYCCMFLIRAGFSLGSCTAGTRYLGRGFRGSCGFPVAAFPWHPLMINHCWLPIRCYQQWSSEMIWHSPSINVLFFMPIPHHWLICCTSSRPSDSQLFNK